MASIVGLAHAEKSHTELPGIPDTPGTKAFASEYHFTKALTHFSAALN